jgi:hypothetical protein
MRATKRQTPKRSSPIARSAIDELDRRAAKLNGAAVRAEKIGDIRVEDELKAPARSGRRRQG